MLPLDGLSSITLLFIGLLLSGCSDLGETAARLIKIPLRSKITQKVGSLGQPVISYHAPIGIGSPHKSFNVQFDVGFNDIFVPHYTWSPFKFNLHYDKGYQCKVSSTCKKRDKSLEIEYQHCVLTGKCYEDLVSLNYVPGAKPSVTIRQQFLAIGDASDGRFKDLPVDGFIGLGPIAYSPVGSKNLLVNLHSNNYIDNLQFSLKFNPVLDSPQGGELVIGGVDTNSYQGQIYWHPSLATSNSWAINLDFVSLGGQIVSCYSKQCHAVLSTGLNEIYGPREDVQRIYNLLSTSHQSSGLELVDCRRIAQMPVLTLTLNGIPHTLYPTNYIRKMVDGVIFKNETCYVAIMASEEAKIWTLGTGFLGAYYSVFDMTHRQVGFASLR